MDENVVRLDEFFEKRKEVHRFTMDFFESNGTYTGIIQHHGDRSEARPSTYTIAEALEQVAMAIRNEARGNGASHLATIAVSTDGEVEVSLARSLDDIDHRWLRAAVNDAIDNVPFDKAE